MSTLLLNISINNTADSIPVLKPGLDPYISTMGDAWDMVLGVTILFIITTGVFFNSLVLWTLGNVRADGRREKKLNSTDYSIIALAASDLSAVLLCYPLTFVSTVSHMWLFGDIGCVVNAFCGFLFSLIDIGVLSSMSVVRLISVKMPHCAFVKTRRCSLIMLVGVTLYALVWTISPILGWGDFAPEPFGTSCTVNWRNPHRSYVTAVFTGVLAIPLLTMLICYSGVVHHMRASSARLGRLLGKRNKRAQKQARLVRMAVLMCVCFLVIWLPYSVLSICFAYIPYFDVHPVQSAIPTLLAKTSHVVNPLIYFTMNPSYRRRIKCSCLRHMFSYLSDFQNGERERDSDHRASEHSSYHLTQMHNSSSYTVCQILTPVRITGQHRQESCCLSTFSKTGNECNVSNRVLKVHSGNKHIITNNHQHYATKSKSLENLLKNDSRKTTVAVFCNNDDHLKTVPSFV